MRNTHCRNWIMARKQKNVKNEKYTLQDLGCCEKTDKRGKCKSHMVGSGNMLRNTEKRAK